MRWVAQYIVILLIVTVFLPMSETRYIEREKRNDSLAVMQSDDEYMSLSTNKMIVQLMETNDLTVTMTNIDSHSHNFTFFITAMNQYIRFFFNGVAIDPTETNDTIYLYNIPHTFDDIVFNRSIAYNLGVSGDLPLGIVYNLCLFSIGLCKDGVEIEEQTVQVFISRSYETVQKYAMNNTGFLAPNVQYHANSNPLLASIASVLTVTINNTDSLPHQYTIIIHDKVGNLRIFEGNYEHQRTLAYPGYKFTIEVGNVFAYDSLPLSLSVSQVSGVIWSRHMVDISIKVDETTHDAACIGLDVGNNIPTPVSVEKIYFERLNDDEIRASVYFESDGLEGNSLFAITIPENDMIALFRWIGGSFASAILTKAVFPSLFESFPVAGLQIAIIGFCISTGVGFIIQGVLMLESDTGLGVFFIILGLVMLVLVIVAVCVKYSD